MISISRLLLLLAALAGALIACTPESPGSAIASVVTSTSGKSKPKSKSATEALQELVGKFDNLSEQHRELADKFDAHVERYKRELAAGERWGKRVEGDLRAEKDKRLAIERQLVSERLRADEAEQRTEQFLIDMAGPKADAVFDKIRLNQSGR